MSRIFTKRNAVLGWLTWRAGKKAARRRARRALEGRVKFVAAMGSIAALAAGAASVARRREPPTG